MTHYQSEQMKGVWRIHMYMYIHGIHSYPTIDSSIFKNLTVIIFVWELMQIGIPNIYVQSGYWMILNQCNVYIYIRNIFKNTENIQFNHGADNPICMHRNSIHNVRCTFWGRKREQILQTFALTFIQYIHARGPQRGETKQHVIMRNILFLNQLT